MRAKTRRFNRFFPALLLLVSLAAARGLLIVTGSTEAIARVFPLKCPLRATTGIPCPTCGLGHALVDAWVGRWESSLSHHPLGIAILFLSALLALLYLARPDSAKSHLRRLGRALSERPRLLIGAVVVYLLIGLTRALFHLLARS